MSPFAALFERVDDRVMVEQQRIRDGFPDAVATSSLTLRSPESVLTGNGTEVIVGLGVAWNKYDQELLVLIDRAVSEGRTDDRVEVFDIDTIGSEAEFRGVLPGCELGPITPHLGVWRAGDLLFGFSGAAASAWLGDRYTAVP